MNQKKYNQIKSKYPDKTPVLVEGVNIDKVKYLVPIDFTISQFVYVIRRRMKLDPEVALYCMIKYNRNKNKTIIPVHSDFVSKYEEKDFVTFYFSIENFFG